MWRLMAKKGILPENFRNAFDYLITMLNGTKSSFNHAVKVADRELTYVICPGDCFIALIT